MSKRPAEFQLTKEDAEKEDQLESKQVGIEITQEKTASESDSKSDTKTEEQPKTESSAGFGFGSYAKINPFMQALKQNGSGGFGSFSSFGSSQGTESKSDAPTSSGFSKFASFNPKGLTVDIKSTTENISLATPSPKPERVNPFSSVSPKINPFVKIVDNKSNDNIWPEKASTQSIAAKNNSAPPAFKTFFTTYNKTADENNDDDKEDNDDDNENDDAVVEEEATGPTLTKIYQLPENVTVVTGEENENCELQWRVKLFRWSIPNENQSSDEGGEESTPATATDTSVTKSTEGKWVEVGVGPAKILSEITTTIDGENVKKYKKYRVVVRREDKKGGAGTKLLLNAMIRSYVTLSKQGDKALLITCVHPEREGKEPSPQTYLLKVKLPQEMSKAYDILTAAVASAKANNY